MLNNTLSYKNKTRNKSQQQKQNNKTRKYKKGKNYKKNNKSVFNNEDYKDNNGMMTYIWGPPLWFVIHTISFNYPVNPTEEEKKNYKDFVYNLRNILPCKYCRINLTNNLKESPIREDDLKNRETFSRYIYNLHNIINKMLGKKVNITYDEVRDKYENFRARCNDADIKNKVFDFKTQHKKGCTVPLIGRKSKCVLRIVPKENKTETLKISRECYKKRLTPK